MNIVDYSKIIQETAIYPKEVETYPNYNGSEYTKMGLIEEYGEVIGKIKKFFRDDNGIITDRFIENLTLELGDCFWYLCAYCKEENLSFVACFESSKRFNTPISKNLFTHLKLGVASISNLISERDSDLKELYVLSTIVNLTSIAENFNIEITDILYQNYEKLISRRKNNTISGSGDYR
jgi:NTP pyrophosphatase (non-canonical NTP hydrolase)